MKVLMLNGSPRANGNTKIALEVIGKTLNEEGIDYEIVDAGAKPINDCIACGKCSEIGECVFKDDGVNEFVSKAKDAHGFIFGSPVYYAHPTGRILSFLDRAFFSGSSAMAHKPAAGITVARRGGLSATYDVLNKYAGINQMPIVTSSYWNQAHGRMPGEALQDEEGMQTMVNLAKNMAWMLKCIEVGKEKGISAPENNTGVRTHFIR